MFFNSLGFPKAWFPPIPTTGCSFLTTTLEGQGVAVGTETWRWRMWPEASQALPAHVISKLLHVYVSEMPAT